MKNTVQTPSVPAPAAAAERFAQRVTARLSGGIDELPYEISERLRAARVQALARRKPVAPAWRTAPADTIVHAGGYATLGRGGWWGALVSAVPLLALVVGLVFINMAQDECSAHDVAEVDAALLTDDLPPAAYADQGFVQFLKTSAQLD